MNFKKFIIILICIAIFITVVSVLSLNRRYYKQSKHVSATVLSNKKIGWGVLRNSNHEQPDLGNSNLKLLGSYNGIAIGNKDDKFVYLTFDEGYEAGYTSKLLDILKENNVKAAFFVTAHYFNSQPELIKRMIDEGHIIRKSHSKS